jgi:hypothetical protein
MAYRVVNLPHLVAPLGASLALFEELHSLLPRFEAGCSLHCRPTSPSEPGVSAQMAQSQDLHNTWISNCQSEETLETNKKSNIKSRAIELCV